MAPQTKIKISVADGLLTGLKQLGVDYIFGNTGTDYPPLIGSLSRFRQANGLGRDVPIPMAVQHENVAVNMAYGYYLATGKPQVVMVHTSVGTANAICGMLNASRGQVPIIVMAGKAPVTEDFDRVSKPGFIHWAQEMFDQAGMVREAVKWDYHISSDNMVELDLILQRAITMATTHPPGPVYLTFAPEAMEKMIELPERIALPTAVSKPQPDSESVAQIAQWLGQAKHPLIITGGTSREHTILPALTGLADAYTIPVASLIPRSLHFPMNHPLYLGMNPHPAVPEADLIIALDTDVPFMPLVAKPAADCRVVHIGPDPVFQQYPRRGYRSDANVCSDVTLFLKGLQAAMTKPSNGLAQERIAWVTGLREAAALSRQKEVERAKERGEMTFGWVSHCLAEAIDGDTVILREFDLHADYLSCDRPGSYFGQPNTGGLGWGLGTALGIRLAEPERTVITVTGDGCYYFGNPTAAHAIANAHGLPFMTIVFNNAKWATVVNHTNRWYPELEEENPPLTSFGPRPDFDKVVVAFGGYGERVEQPEDLPAALQRALHTIRDEGRQALLNIIC